MQEMDQQAGKAQVYEADDVVREIMQRQDELEQLTEEVKGRRAAAGGGAAAAQAELEAATASAFALQVEMQKCVDEERYEDAATKRDMLQDPAHPLPAAAAAPCPRFSERRAAGSPVAQLR